MKKTISGKKVISMLLKNAWGKVKTNGDNHQKIEKASFSYSIPFHGNGVLPIGLTGR